MPKVAITRKQQGYLFRKGSPLTEEQKRKLADEIRSRKTKIVSNRAALHRALEKG